MLTRGTKGNGLPKLTVVIPTRERADVLYHTLRTVIEQDYSELEIVVSDNASNDNTRDVAESFNDARVKYTVTKKRVGMSSNWEHGLSNVTGDYVMFLGDDDGLLPSACADIAEIIESMDTKAVIWNKADYTWPSITAEPNTLVLDMRDDLIEMNGTLLMRLLANGITSYGRLPVVYSGFVSMKTIDSIKKRSGNFFLSVTPDVYSGIVLAPELRSYLYSMRPFSLNGGSYHSNGIASTSNSKAKQRQFFAEADIDMHAKMKVIPGSIASCVAEAFLQAADHGLTGGIKLNESRMTRVIFNELLRQPTSVRYDRLRMMAEMELPKSIRKLVDKELSRELKHSSIQGLPSAIKNKSNENGNYKLVMNCDEFGVSNSYDASKLLGALVGKYRCPKHIHKATIVSYSATFASRYLRNIFDRWVLPF